jgi:BirA family biotin operon repressor/biotin-[acetyl-CoA-carboxylase] ligase
VRVELLAGSLLGRAVDITADGHLVVQPEGSPSRVVTAGDVVHVRDVW